LISDKKNPLINLIQYEQKILQQANLYSNVPLPTTPPLLWSTLSLSSSEWSSTLVKS